jgi:hypothetical protein
MSIYTMSDELLGLARTDTIVRLESVLKLENELIEKLAQLDTEVARRKRYFSPPWDERSPWDTLEEESSDVV